MNYFPLIFLLMLSLALPSCYHLDEQTETDELGYRRVFQTDPEGARQGLLKEYDPDGKLVVEENYVDDMLDGERRLYNQEGNLVVRETYVADEFDGPYYSYNENGNLILRGSYSGGAMKGLWYGFYPDGSVKEEVTFAGNQENGPFREWYPDGVPKASGNYRGGDKEDGTLHLYDEQGNLRRVMECQAGICNSVWEPDSTDAPAAGVDMTVPEVAAD